MHTKDKGSLAEAKFLVKAAEKGFSVLVPWGDNRPYDLVIEKDGCFLRVQIKSCYSKQFIKQKLSSYRYICNVRVNSLHRLRYSSDTVDIMAVYIEPEDIWYIIPASFIDKFGGTTLHFYPCTIKPTQAVSEQFREKWDSILSGDKNDQHTSSGSCECSTTAAS